jgi:hypothetical protein
MSSFAWGSEDALVKVYISARYYARNDQEVVEALAWYMTNVTGLQANKPPSIAAASIGPPTADASAKSCELPLHVP